MTTLNHEAARAARVHEAQIVLTSVRRLVEAMLVRGENSDHVEVATLLGFHPRTMHRRLAVLDTTYQAVRSEILINRAKALLVRGEQIKNIYSQLGYSTEPAFHRAFTRVTGTSARRWLRAFLEGGAV